MILLAKKGYKTNSRIGDYSKDNDECDILAESAKGYYIVKFPDNKVELIMVKRVIVTESTPREITLYSPEDIKRMKDWEIIFEDMGLYYFKQ